MVFKKLLLFKWINLFLFCNVISPSVKGATLRSAASGGEGATGAGGSSTLEILGVNLFNLQYKGISLKEMLIRIHEEAYAYVSSLSAEYTSPNYVKAKLTYVCRASDGRIEAKEASTSFERFAYVSGYGGEVSDRDRGFINLKDIYGLEPKDCNDLEGKAKDLKADWQLKGVTDFKSKTSGKTIFDGGLYAHSEQVFFSHMLRNRLMPPKMKEKLAISGGGASAGDGGGAMSPAEFADLKARFLEAASSFLKTRPVVGTSVSSELIDEGGSGGATAVAAAAALPAFKATGGGEEEREVATAAGGGAGGKEEVAAAGARPVESVVVSRDDIPEAVIINIVSTNSPCRNCMQMMLNILKDGSEFKNRLLKNWFPGLPADRNLDEIKVYIIYTYKYKQESFSMPAIVDSSTYELSVLKYGMILHGHA